MPTMTTCWRSRGTDAMDDAHVPDAFHRRQVEAMAGYGLAEAEIAKVLDIDPETLRAYYRRELETGQIKTNASVAESLFRQATGEGRQAVTAAIFWLKTRARWRETAPGAEAEPVSLEVRVHVVSPTGEVRTMPMLPRS